MSSRRRAAIWVGAVVGGLVLVAGAVILAFRDRATPLDPDDLSALTLVAGGSEPGDFGLYVYETAGFETTDALGGSRHDYPAETFLTLQPGGCGTRARWLALEQRWTEWEICDGPAVTGWDSFHEWFGVSNLDEWRCTSPIPMAADEVGAAWSGECTKGDTAQTVTYEVVGTETLDVGGETVETIHVRTASTNTGDTRGSGGADLWILPGTPLVVQRIAETTSVSRSRIGDVEYHEEYQLRLRSLVPRQ